MFDSGDRVTVGKLVTEALQHVEPVERGALRGESTVRCPDAYSETTEHRRSSRFRSGRGRALSKRDRLILDHRNFYSSVRNWSVAALAAQGTQRIGIVPHGDDR